MHNASPTIGEVPEGVQGVTFRQQTMVGTARITINEADGEPFETIIVLGKGGMDITADSEAIGRLISLYLRTPSPISNMKKLGLVVEQLSGIGGAQPFGFGPNKVLSLPDAMAKALERYLHAKAAAEQGEAAQSSTSSTVAAASQQAAAISGRVRHGHERHVRCRRRLRPEHARASGTDERGLVPGLWYVFVHQSRRLRSLLDVRPQHVLGNTLLRPKSRLADSFNRRKGGPHPGGPPPFLPYTRFFLSDSRLFWPTPISRTPNTSVQHRARRSMSDYTSS